MFILMDDSCDSSIHDHTSTYYLSVGEIHSDDMMSCKILHEEYAEVFAFLIHLYIIPILMDSNVESLYILKSSPGDATS